MFKMALVIVKYRISQFNHAKVGNLCLSTRTKRREGKQNSIQKISSEPCSIPVRAEKQKDRIE